MKDKKSLLPEGIEILCKSDDDIKRLIAPCMEEIISRLSLYIDEIELFNPAYGLVGINDTDELVIRHILDSLSPLGIIYRKLKESFLPQTTQTSANEEDAAGKIADAGSGAGLPGIPLAIALPECEFTLIERMGRRVGFLLNTRAALALPNVLVEECELEKAACRRFDFVVFRAFKPLEPKLLKTLFKACKPGGIIAAYKGKREKIQEEIASLQKTADNADWEIIPYSVPFLEEERHLLVIKSGDMHA